MISGRVYVTDGSCVITYGIVVAITKLGNITSYAYQPSYEERST
jgi:hypothetical protein